MNPSPDHRPTVRFGPKHPDVVGKLVRAAPGRLVVQSAERFALYTTLHLEVETESGWVRARGVVERVVPLGPWPTTRATAQPGAVALTVLVFSDSPGLDALVAQLSARDERRRLRRFAEPVRASLGTPSALGWTRVANLSGGGAYLEHPAPPAQDLPLSFRLHLPDDGPPLRVAARVVHRLDEPRASALGAAPGVGVAFDGLAPADALRLDAFLARLAEPDE